MRTTLSLDDDVALQIRREMRRTGAGLKATVNAALRRGLGPPARGAKRRFRVQAHGFGFRAGVDLDRLNQLVDELESAATARKLAQGR